MTRRTMYDPNCCMWVVSFNHTPLVWAYQLVHADDTTGEILLVRRSGPDDTVMPYNDAGWFAKQPCDWFDGAQVATDRRVGHVEITPVADADAMQQAEWAYWQGRIDVSMQRKHWGRIHYPYRYDEQDAYDLGYAEGLIL